MSDVQDYRKDRLNEINKINELNLPEEEKKSLIRKALKDALKDPDIQEAQKIRKTLRGDSWKLDELLLLKKKEILQKVQEMSKEEKINTFLNSPESHVWWRESILWKVFKDKEINEKTELFDILLDRKVKEILMKDYSEYKKKLIDWSGIYDYSIRDSVEKLTETEMLNEINEIFIKYYNKDGLIFNSTVYILLDIIRNWRKKSFSFILDQNKTEIIAKRNLKLMVERCYFGNLKFRVNGKMLNKILNIPIDEDRKISFVVNNIECMDDIDTQECVDLLKNWIVNRINVRIKKEERNRSEEHKSTISTLISKFKKPFTDEVIYYLIKSGIDSPDNIFRNYIINNKNAIWKKIGKRVLDELIMSDSYLLVDYKYRELFDESCFNKELYTSNSDFFMQQNHLWALKLCVKNSPDIVEELIKNPEKFDIIYNILEFIDPSKYQKIIENYDYDSDLFKFRWIDVFKRFVQEIDRLNNLKWLDFKWIIENLSSSEIEKYAEILYEIEQKNKNSENIIDDKIKPLLKEIAIERDCYKIKKVAEDNYQNHKNYWACKVNYTNNKGQKFVVAAIVDKSQSLQDAQLAILSTDSQYHKDIVEEYRGKWYIVEPIGGWFIQIDDNHITISGKSDAYSSRESYTMFIENTLQKEYPALNVILQRIPVHYTNRHE